MSTRVANCNNYLLRSTSILLLLGVLCIFQWRQPYDNGGRIRRGRGISFVRPDGEGYGPPSVSPSSPSASSVLSIIDDVSIAASTVNRPRRVQSSESSSRISVFAFFDSNDDGIYDVTTSAGIYDTTISLLTCTDEMIDLTKTDRSGYYSFDELPGGQYYISSIPQPWYAFSDAWNGMADETGALLYPNVDSAINPETGSTDCFDLEEGEDKTVSFGLKLGVWSGPATSAPSNAPVSAVATSSPTAPLEPATLEPSNPSIISSSRLPSARPSLSSTLPRSPSPSVTSFNAPSQSPASIKILSTSPSPPSTPMAVPATSSPTVSPSKYANFSSLEPINSTSKSPSTQPSSHTLSPSNNSTIANGSPSLSVTPSMRPSYNFTSNFRPSEMPSASPSRSGELYGPNTTRHVMTIRGIQLLEDEEAWSVATSNYIMAYFNLNGDDPGVFDVTVSIEVINQTSSNGTLHQRQPTNQTLLDGVETFVEYNQTSSFKTSNPKLYNDVYVAMAPFLTRQGTDGYVEALHSLSPYYNDVWYVSLTPIEPPSLISPGGTVEYIKDSVSYLLYGIIFGVIVVVLGFVFLELHRYRTRHVRNEPNRHEDDLEDVLPRRESTDSIPTVDPDTTPVSVSTSLVGFDVSAGSNNSLSLIDGDSPSSRTSVESGSIAGDSVVYKPISDTRKSSSSRVGATSITSIPEVTSFSIIKKCIIAPAGRLGITIETSPNGGPNYIYKIDDSCPIIGQIQLEDEIIALNGEDVRKMGGDDLLNLLASRSRQSERIITILRELSTADVGDGVSGGSSSGGSSGGVGGDGEPIITVSDDSQSISLDAASTEDAPPLMMAAPPSSPPQAAVNLRIPSDSGSDSQSEGTALSLPQDRSLSNAQTPTVEGGGGGEPNSTVPDELQSISLDATSTEDSPPLMVAAPPSSPPQAAVDLPNLNDSGPDGQPEDAVLNLPQDRPLSNSQTPIIGGGGGGEPSSTDGMSTEDSPLKALVSPSALPQAVVDLPNLSHSGSDDETESTAVYVPQDRPLSNSQILTTRIDIIAPSGWLGIVLSNPKDPGPAYVSKIRRDSPLKGNIHLGDRVIAVDDKDVQDMKAFHAADYLSSKSSNVERKITVLREVDVSDDGKVGEDIKAILSSTTSEISEDEAMSTSLLDNDVSLIEDTVDFFLQFKTDEYYD